MTCSRKRREVVRGTEQGVKGRFASGGMALKELPLGQGSMYERAEYPIYTDYWV